MSGHDRAVATGAMARAADVEADLDWLSIDLAGVVAQRNLLREALKTINPTHPALLSLNNTYGEAAIAAGKRVGVRERAVRQWLAEQAGG